MFPRLFAIDSFCLCVVLYTNLWLFAALESLCTNCTPLCNHPASLCDCFVSLCGAFASHRGHFTSSQIVSQP